MNSLTKINRNLLTSLFYRQVCFCVNNFHNKSLSFNPGCAPNVRCNKNGNLTIFNYTQIRNKYQQKKPDNDDEVNLFCFI